MVNAVVLAAAHRQNKAVVGVDTGQANFDVRVAGLVDQRCLFLGTGFLGIGLQVQVDGRIDGQAALEDQVLRILIQQDMADKRREVGLGVNAVDRGALHVQAQLHRLVLHQLGLVDVAVDVHPVQHHVAAAEGVVRVVHRVVESGVLRDAGNHRGLRHRQVRCVLGKIMLGSRLYSPGTVAVVDGVDVHHQHFLFAVLFLQLSGQISLAHLALDGAVVGLFLQYGLAHKLLGDCRRALKLAAGKVGDRRAGDAVVVHAAMLPEPLVLNRHRGVKDVRRDLVGRHRLAVLRIKLRQQGHAVRGIDPGLAGVVKGIGILKAWQLGQPGLHQSIGRGRRITA